MKELIFLNWLRYKSDPASQDDGMDRIPKRLQPFINQLIFYLSSDGFLWIQEIIFVFLRAELFNFGYTPVGISLHVGPTFVWKFFATISANLNIHIAIISIPKYIVQLHFIHHIINFNETKYIMVPIWIDVNNKEVH